MAHPIDQIPNGGGLSAVTKPPVQPGQAGRDGGETTSVPRHSGLPATASSVAGTSVVSQWNQACCERYSVSP
jgi:hypothetical protein